MGEWGSWVIVLECMNATLHGRRARGEGLTTLIGALFRRVAHPGKILRERRDAWGVGLSRHLLHRQAGSTLPPSGPDDLGGRPVAAEERVGFHYARQGLTPSIGRPLLFIHQPCPTPLGSA